MNLPKKLQNKIFKRHESDALRTLPSKNESVDFSSNDYLGFAQSESIFMEVYNQLKRKGIFQNGSTGSRLISGNHQLYVELEGLLSTKFETEAAVIFNSGYDANIGFFSSVPQKGDLILYDEYIHASIRDGIGMSRAKTYKFKHNSTAHLEQLVSRHRKDFEEIYAVTESVFSMDGDSPSLEKFVIPCKKLGVKLIVDEAHALGVFGNKSLGLVSDYFFAKIITFGKALGCHGAAILGSQQLKDYLVNFSRSLIYTTGLPPHSLQTIIVSFERLNDKRFSEKLQENICFFKSELQRLSLKDAFIESNSAIHCCVISGNKKVKEIASQIQKKGFDVKPILSPTVPLGEERIRFCLHSYNSFQEISAVLEALRIFVCT